MKRLYLDNSVLNRPFDDQRQPRIWLETLSFCLILGLIETGEALIARSEIHDFENDQNPFDLRRAWVTECLNLAKIHIPMDDRITTRAILLEKEGLKSLDALHVAAAESVDTGAFLTCDDRLIRRYSGPMRVQTPVDFVMMEQ